MNSKIANPRILLLRTTLGDEKGDDGYTDFAAVVDQEEYYHKILLTKLEQVKPTLIIV